jgi:hypothetical protein
MHVFSFIAALLFGASTPKESPESLIIGRILGPTPIAADLAALGERAKGRWLLIHTMESLEDLSGSPR